MSEEIKYFMGWKPSMPDIRDFRLQSRRIGPLPDAVDLRSEFPKVWNQLSTSSCTANASAALISHVVKKEHGRVDDDLSRLFLYYTTREMDGSVKFDNGATLRDTFKAMAKFGICHEDQWPFLPEKVKVKPPAKAYKEATSRMAKNYFAVGQNEESLKACLAEGYGFVFGFAVYDSFIKSDVKTTGKVPLPQLNERIIGGHAVMCVGYRNDEFIIRNSWGESWGDSGHCYMPTSFISNPGISMDFWTLRSVGN